MKKIFALILLALISIVNLHASTFTPGNIVIVRIGDGSTALSSSAFPVFLEEYTPAGALVQVIALPTVISGANKRFVTTGSSTSEGNITLSGDKHYITLAGYDADIGTASVASTAGISRVVALISESGTINTTTYFTDGFIGSNIRGCYTMDGTSFWTSGTASPAASGGVRYSVLGGLSSVQITNTVTNTRFVYVFNGQLYVSASSGAFLGVNSVGTGVPTTTGQTTVNTINTLTGSSSYAFAFNTAGNVCYIADDRSIASGGGVQKWTFDGSAWSLTYTLNTGITVGCRGVAVNFSGANPVIFATTSNSILASVTDIGAASSFTTLTTGVTNTVYRGVCFAPGVVVSAPSAPNLVSPANNSTGNSTSLTLVWNSSLTATSYRVQLSTDSLFSSLVVNDSTVTDSTKSVSGLLNSTNYWWRVSAKNAGGSSSYSSAFKFTTIVAVPAPPVLVSPANNSVGNLTSLSLIWNKSAGASSYRVRLALDSMFTTIILNDSTLIDSIKAVSGLNPLTNYWWAVNAKNAAGTSAYSTVYKFRTLGVPARITGTFVPANGATGQPTTVNFRWSRALDQTLAKINNVPIRFSDQTISNYWFELTPDSVALTGITRDSLLTDTNKTVSGLNYSTTYYWRVKAKNQIGWGSFSFWQRFTTVPLPPATVTLKVIPGGFYNTATGMLRMRDTIRVYLVDSATCLRVDSNKVVIDSVTFSTNLSFSNAPTGNYYMYVYHRNHLPVASRFRQNIIRGSNVSYDLTTDSAKAYGFNMIKVSNSPVRWALIPGDANRDEFVDGLDQTAWAIQNGSDGYLAGDFNGDGFVDGLDQTIWIGFNGYSSVLPCSTPGPQSKTGKIGVNNENKILASDKFELYNNYPNPFNPVTRITYNMPRTGFASLKVYDINGRQVAALVNELKQQGVYTVNFDGANLASGVYFYKLETGAFTETKKMLLVK